MAYELTCPSCRVRLALKEETGEKFLLCPRCLNMVPHPTVAAYAHGAALAPVTSVSAQPGRVVPSVESDVKTSSWSAYFIVLALTLLAVVGAVLNSLTGWHDQSFQMRILLLIGLLVVLTILILYPIGRGLFRATAPEAGAAPGNIALRRLGIIVLLVVLAPVAFSIVVFTVCTATFLTLAVGH